MGAQAFWLVGDAEEGRVKLQVRGLGGLGTTWPGPVLFEFLLSLKVVARIVPCAQKSCLSGMRWKRPCLLLKGTACETQGAPQAPWEAAVGSGGVRRPPQQHVLSFLSPWTGGEFLRVYVCCPFDGRPFVRHVSLLVLPASTPQRFAGDSLGRYPFRGSRGLLSWQRTRSQLSPCHFIARMASRPSSPRGLHLHASASVLSTTPRPPR